MKNISFIILFILAFSCKQNENVLEKPNAKAETKSITTDTLYRLLDAAINKDSLDFDNYEPFLHLKVGKFLSPEVKNAFLVSNVKDSIHKLELYTLSSGKWVKNDEQTVTDAYLLQFELRFDDYNFDGQKDIFMQSTASNGYSISRGHLITINPETLKMELHPETRDYGSMIPDKIKKIVYSCTPNKCHDSLQRGSLPPCQVVNKWKNNKLVFISIEECPCTKITN